MQRVLILTDGKPGHENQSRAFADALNTPYDLLTVAYPTPRHKALSYLLDRLGCHTPKLFGNPTLPTANYSAIITAGSTTCYPGKVLARRLNLPQAAILYPRGYRLHNLACILAPAFDNPRPRPNLITLPVNLTATTPEFYRAGTAAFQQRHTQRRPAVAISIGGPNKVASMEPAWMRAQLEQIFALHPDCEYWVTTSRRTPPAVEAIVDSLPFDYKLIFSRDNFNPIPAFVSLAQTLYLTADSTGMLSEAVTQGTAAVGVLMNLRNPHSKFARFIHNLHAISAATPFSSSAITTNAKIDLTPYLQQAANLLFS